MAEKIITDSECEVRSIMAEAHAKAISADLYAGRCAFHSL